MSTDPRQPNGMVLGAADTIWLPHSPQFVFDYIQDERNHPQWDVLGNHSPVQVVTHIANGAHPGKCIFVLMGSSVGAPHGFPVTWCLSLTIDVTSQANMLILHESCTDSSGSLVVYCPVDLHAINIAMSGEHSVYIPLLASGFAISTTGRHSTTGSTASTSGNMGGASTGSLVTLVLLMLVSSSLPWRKLGPQSMATINNLLGSTVQQSKAVLNCTSTTS